MISDEQIMLEISEGNVALTAQIFERYHALLTNYYIKTTFDPSLSQDLVQTVFEKIIRYKSSFRRNHSFKSWVFKIANNVLHDHYRKEKNHKNRNEAYSRETEDFVAPDHGKQIVQEEILLHKALNQLPYAQREIILMTRFQKMKYIDIAEILECSESAVKVKVHRALKRLKSEYLRLEIP
jgi:RNA polymerase sigma-70 factor (ECF subfamily)